ncbi:archease [Candidatus Woesearchaeota archaeon]|nr:archease [Candidatus Woesearchaeota archaeon]
MKEYEFLEHTADIKFRAYGKSLENVFSNAALAFGSILIKPEKVESNEEKIIKVNGNDEKSLLYNFLEELLFLFDTEGFLLNNIENMKIESKDKVFFLKAKAKGDFTKNKKYELETEPKAVTYNEMEVKKEKSNYIIQVVIDI